MGNKSYHLSREIAQYGWCEATKTTEKVIFTDTYDPMDWDDLVSNIGYMLEGHKGTSITIKIRMDKEDTDGE